MLPESLDLSEDKSKASLTFEIDLEKKQLLGLTDGLEAVKQTVFLMLKTERGFSEIYRNYGLKTDHVIGKDTGFALSEIQRLITDCLLEDDRIIRVTDFEIETDGDLIYSNFTVVSTEGNVNVSEVTKWTVQS